MTEQEFDPKAMKDAIKAIAAQPPRPPTTIHHPKCEALTTGSLHDCTCGGWAFPV